MVSKKSVVVQRLIQQHVYCSLLWLKVRYYRLVFLGRMMQTTDVIGLCLHKDYKLANN